MLHKLIIGESGTPQTFADLGIVQARHKVDATGFSSLELEVTGDISSAFIIQPFQVVSLVHYPDPVGSPTTYQTRFVGWMDASPRQASGDRETVRYVLNGPHRFLERANYVQSRAGLAILGGSAGWAEQTAPQPWNASAEEIFGIAYALYPITFNAAATPLIFETPTRFRADVSCATALSNLMAFAPSAVVRWSHAAPGESEAEIRTFPGSPNKTLSATGLDLSAASLNARYDLLADTVVVYFMRDNEVAGNDNAESAGDAATLGADRKVIFTYDTGVLNNLPAAGIAAALAAWYQKLHIDGSATKEAVDWTDFPGDLYSFAGTKFAHYAAYSTELHTVERDLMAERTTLTFGVMPGRTIFKVNDFDTGAVPAVSTFAGGAIPTGNVAVGTSGITVTNPTGGQVQLDAANLPSGETATFRQVVRCDGYTAWVCMSDWVPGA